MTTTPVVLMVFNRPEHTARVFARIREARPSRLFVIADGPRPGLPIEAERCQKVRDIIESGLDWPCKYTPIYARSNLGCGSRISTGLNEVFENVEEAAILEDDCLPSQSFFDFVDILIERYRDSDKVAQISGCSFLSDALASRGTSYYFSIYPHCWGWATWRRAWKHYDHAMKGWNGSLDEIPHCGGPLKKRERKQWEQRFNSVSAGTIDTWAYRWTYSLWRLGLLSANSRRNLVSNIGFGPDATHTHTGVLGNIPLAEAAFPLRHPVSVDVDVEEDEFVSRTVFLPPSLFHRVLRKLRT